MPMTEVDWIKRWGEIVEARDRDAAGHSDPAYWDRRAPSFARSTQSRVDDFLRVLEPYLTPRKTLIDVGAGAGRHAVPLAERLEWVTAVEPSEGMRSHITPRDNITVIASTWEDAEVAPADLVICSHVLYGVADPVPFLEKLERSAHERVFVMLRETDLPHAATELRRRLRRDQRARMPRFSDLFMLLIEMGIAPDVTFISYPIRTRYADMEEALTDVRGMYGEGWDENAGRAVLSELLQKDGRELVYDGGVALSGVAHWQPRKS
ncbi:MAG TPA: methyltransferase domain-containing protein [Candidatus Dormibacteraeota bacterium]|nr:methyltransferase domain-containing protein [Candidatus Dormibacteraeota bacterium]